LFDDAVSLQNMLIDCTAAILLTLLNFKVRRVLRWLGVVNWNVKERSDVSLL